MNMLDLAAYLPELGRLTSGLASSLDEKSRCYADRHTMKTNTSKSNKLTKARKSNKVKAVMLVKKPVVTSQPYAYRSSQWTRPQSPPIRKQKASIFLPKVKRASQLPRKIKKKKSNLPTSGLTDKLLKATEDISHVGNAKDFRLIQQAIDEFKSERDQFVHSLGGLQRKLLKFRIPNLLSPTVNLEKLSEIPKNVSKIEKKGSEGLKDGRNRKKLRKKNVRSVSQHFFLADMTDSDPSSSSSSSSDSKEDENSELELSKRKVSKFLDFDLIPIQPPENRQSRKANNPLAQGRKVGPTPKKIVKPTTSKPLSAQLTQLRKNVSEMTKRIPTKTEMGKVKASQESSSASNEVQATCKQSWNNPELSPKTKAAVTSEFKKLKMASEIKLRKKLKKTIAPNISLTN